MISDMLSDDEFLSRYLNENSAKLAKSCQLVIQTLESLNIPLVKPSAGMFLWADLSSLLPHIALKYKVVLADKQQQQLSSEGYLTSDQAFELEDMLYKDLWKEAGIVATPGSSQHSTLAGSFRFCYAAVSYEILEAGMKKLIALVLKLREN
jgi:aspartate/methionine/tyrosine aminotransferase